MFSYDHFLHFVFDYRNELHYTENLLVLEPEAYLWHELRRQGTDIALFVAERGSGITLEAFDSASAEVLKPEKKGFFQISKAPSLEEQRAVHHTYTLRDIDEEEDTLLEWLLERPEQKGLKKKRTALVLSLEGFTVLWQQSNPKVRQRLLRQIERPDGQCILILRLPLQTKALEEAFFGKSELLPQLCPGIGKAMEGPREPLMEALRRQLGDRMVSFHRAEDTLNMLLRQALEEGKFPDSLRELEEQAAYLRLRYPHMGPAVKRRDLYEQLRQPGFREELRRRTAQLRQKYPELTVAEALKADGLTAADRVALEYDDPLVRNLTNLYLPEEFFSQAEDGPALREALAGIKQDFSTLWNRRRSAAVCRWADAFYSEARTAGAQGDWDTLRDALQLLRFCGEQICAAPEQEEALDVIFEIGKTVLDLSYNQFQEKNFRTLFRPTQAPTGWYADKLKTAQIFHDDVARIGREDAVMQLHTFRTTLQTLISQFHERKISNDTAREIFEREQQLLADKLTEAEAVPAVAQEPPEAKEEEHWCDDWAMTGEWEDILPEKKGPYTAADREADRQAGERLRKSMGLH